MKSVNSPSYLIVGSGRVAQHFKSYLSLKSQSFRQWSRASDPELSQFPELLQSSDVALLLISDRALESFYREQIRPWMEQTTDHTVQLVHCSGSLSHPKMLGFHPLMSFDPSESYEIETYRKMAFVGDAPEAQFRELFPSFHNPYFQIPPQERAYYHSLCVLGGNLSTWLWQQVMDKMASHLDIPAEALWPYMDQLSKNLKANPEAALTGPIVRGDQKTIDANLKALESRGELGLKKIYQAFAEGVRHEN